MRPLKDLLFKGGGKVQVSDFLNGQRRF